jgi:ABC-2 type transport system ATP-binding protein
MADNSVVIEILGLTKKFGSLVAVNNIDLTVEKGTIHGFLGPNGAGKTTTIRCALALLRPNKGEVRIFGEIMSPNKTNIQRNVGYLPGEVHLYPYYSVKQLLDYYGNLYGNQNPPLRQELVKRFNLDENTKTKALSKGNRQKVGIIQALMHDPDLLILDEPSSGLDPLLQNVFYKVLREFRDRGKTIFFSSHVLSEVQKVCDYVSVIRKGDIVSSEDVSTLVNKIQRKIVLTFNDNNIVDPPSFPNLEFINREGEKFNYLVKGDIKDSISQLNTPNVENIIIPELSVEDYFLAYYQKEK